MSDAETSGTRSLTVSFVQLGGLQKCHVSVVAMTPVECLHAALLAVTAILGYHGYSQGRGCHTADDLYKLSAERDAAG